MHFLLCIAIIFQGAINKKNLLHWDLLTQYYNIAGKSYNDILG